jgi:hypothetical protein
MQKASQSGLYLDTLTANRFRNGRTRNVLVVADESQKEQDARIPAEGMSRANHSSTYTVTRITKGD